MSWDAAPASPAEFATFDAFLAWLADVYRRPLDGGRYAWCPEWHRHPEAASRLQALWEALEALAPRPAGRSTWWLQHADPTMAVLLDREGPFRACAHGHRDAAEPLPLTSRG